MTRRLFTLALTASLVVSAFSGSSSAATGGGSVTGPAASDDCSAGLDGVCSASATADSSGAFSAAADLISPDSSSNRSWRYAQGLASYIIGFDLERTTREVTIDVTLDLEEASASWEQAVPEVFGGAKSADSGAKVLFQLLGHDAPDGCGCGWFIQDSPNVVPVKAVAAGDSESISDEQVQVTMVGTNPYGDGLLPAGHYEARLRAYARADLGAAGDWGTLTASVTGSIADVAVTTPAEATTLTLVQTESKSSRTLTATLTDSASAPIDGKTISFYGDGTFLGTAQTQNGVATWPLSGKFRGGKRIFRAEFAGDDTYTQSFAQIGG
ncbi:MAG: Ig-like domain-containing protein [Actinomycetota bacterium]|nr:Ig-like domain-containing protein [Actinomycetota bacterium]